MAVLGSLKGKEEKNNCSHLALSPWEDFFNKKIVTGELKLILMIIDVFETCIFYIKDSNIPEINNLTNFSV